MSSLQAAVALSQAEVSPGVWHRLIAVFKTPEAVLQASPVEIESLKGISKQAKERIRHAAETIDSVDTTLQRLQSLGVTPVPIFSADYPALLKEIPDAPAVLYVRGSLQESDRFAVSIVGSRSPRPYGLQVAKKLASDLVSAGLTIVSGGARGIDAAAHNGALESGGRTIAVLGCGVDIAYPAEHRHLFERISENGAVVSEFPLGAPPEQWRFPRRNRIISGLSRGVIVCDAPEDSGSLITATYAVEQNRDVFAVPGNIDSDHNRGPHKLLKDGAKLVESAADILSEYNLSATTDGTRPATLPQLDLLDDEKKILAVLDLEPVGLDDIIEKTGLTASDASGLLTFLEMKGLVKRVAGAAYVRHLG